MVVHMNLLVCFPVAVVQGAVDMASSVIAVSYCYSVGRSILLLCESVCDKSEGVCVCESE